MTTHGSDDHVRTGNGGQLGPHVAHGSALTGSLACMSVPSIMLTSPVMDKYAALPQHTCKWLQVSSGYTTRIANFCNASPRQLYK